MTRGDLSEALVASFSSMAETEMDGLRRFALAVSADPHRADDLVQAALERVYLVWGRVHAVEHPGAYVRTVLVRLAMREQRLARWRREASTASVPESAGPDQADTTSDRLDLHVLLATLTVRQRAVVVLRHVEDRPVSEVAEVLGVSEGTVKRTSSDALALLRRRASAGPPTTGPAAVGTTTTRRTP